MAGLLDEVRRASGECDGLPVACYVGALAAPSYYARPNERTPVFEARAGHGGFEPPPCGNAEAAATLARMADLPRSHVIGAGVAFAYAESVRLLDGYASSATVAANRDRWASYEASQKSGSWARFTALADNVPRMVGGAWTTDRHAISATGCGPGWAVDQVERVVALGSTDRPRVTVLLSATWVGGGTATSWTGRRGGFAFADASGVTVPATASQVASALCRVADACAGLVDPPEVVLAMCTAEKVFVALRESPPRQRLNVAYFVGAHPSDLLPFTSAMLVACNGDSGQFVSMYNESLPALLAMDAAKDVFEPSVCGGMTKAVGYDERAIHHSSIKLLCAIVGARGGACELMLYFELKRIVRVCGGGGRSDCDDDGRLCVCCDAHEL
jgi:hypothetical protein